MIPATISMMLSTTSPVMGLEGEVGVIAPGKLADIVIWNSDPLADITVLQRPSEISTIIKGHGPLTELAIAVGPRVRISFAPAGSQVRTRHPGARPRARGAPASAACVCAAGSCRTQSGRPAAKLTSVPSGGSQRVAAAIRLSRESGNPGAARPQRFPLFKLGQALDPGFRGRACTHIAGPMGNRSPPFKGGERDATFSAAPDCHEMCMP